MFTYLAAFFLEWTITALAMWGASRLFSSIRFSGTSALVVSALLLVVANALVMPLLVVLSLPLAILSLGGLLLLVLNGMLLLLVARLVNGFEVDGFWTAFWAGLFISVLNLVIGDFVLPSPPQEING